MSLVILYVDMMLKSKRDKYFSVHFQSLESSHPCYSNAQTVQTNTWEISLYSGVLTGSIAGWEG